jgi:NAD(P)-dependent dehydrogenase (short-subunit alcohol dehydrogenase family)
MRKRVIMITGAAGEIGNALSNQLAKQGTLPLLSLDLQPLPAGEAQMTTHIQGDILDQSLLSRLISEYEIDTIYHLAALLSTRAEFTPESAHRANVEGTLVLASLASGTIRVAWHPGLSLPSQPQLRLWSARPRDKASIRACVSGNGIIHAPCTAVTSYTANNWASTSCHYRQPGS